VKRNIKNASAATVALISSIALLGWWTDHAALSAWLPGFADMTFNTALCLMLVALACYVPDNRLQTYRSTQMGAGAVVGIFAALSLAQDIFGLDFGIDNFLFDAHGLGLSSAFPGRMSPLMTATAFLLSAAILFTLNYQKKQRHFALTHMLILLLTLLASIGIGMGIFMHNVPDSYSHLASISPFTALSFLLLSIALLCIFQTRSNINTDLLLHSGIQLMYRLRYPQKFALISIVFMIPLVILMRAELNLQEQHVQQARLKLIGIQHIKETNQLLKVIAEHRGMSNAHLSAPDIFSTTLRAKSEQVDRLFAENTAMDRLHAASIKVPNDWPGILARWNRIKTSPTDALTSWRLHTEIIALIHKHLRSVGKQTMLSYDPDPAIHNRLVLQLEVMPNILEQIGQLRGLGAGFMAGKEISRHDQIMLATKTSHVSLLLDEANQLMHDNRPTHHAQTTLATLAKFSSISKAFISTVRQQLIQGNRFSIGVEDYFTLGTAAIESVNAFDLSNIVHIKYLLDQRINASITTQYNIKLMAMSVVLILLFLFAAFYRSVMNTITALDQVSEKMRRGETGGLNDIPASDEMSDIVGSFSAIAEELMQVSSHMRAVVDHSVEGIITIDQDGIIQSFNPAAEHIFGFHASEVIEKNITMLMPEKYRIRHEAGLRQYLATGEGTMIGKPVDLHGLKQNGDAFPMELSINTMVIDSQQMFIGMVRDTTEHQALENQLRHAQKMEAVGALVGGVAHNFNNMLAGIVGKAYMAKRKAQDRPELLSYLESIESISTQAGDMIKQLLTFAHKDFLCEQQDTPLDILIKESFKTASLSIAEDIKLDLHMPDTNLMVHCDANQVQQVLMNMMNNARDALQDCADKRITVGLQRCLPDNDFFQRHKHLAVGEYACLMISDTGHGMDADTVARIFEPFYTTKAVDKGTGLGLSTAFGTITSHNGIIEVDSQPGSGTSFRIYLPLIEATATDTESTHQQPAVPSSKHETLLLVDDEPVLLSSNKEVLEELGYKVIKARNGKQGLQQFRKHQHSIDAIITDVVMPEMSGIDMVRKIRAIKYGMPVIFITGYNQDQVKLLADERHNTMILTKPVLIPALSQHIEAILSHKDFSY